MLVLDPLVDLFPVNCDIFRGIDTDSHLVSLYAKDSDCDFVTDSYNFV